MIVFFCCLFVCLFSKDKRPIRPATQVLGFCRNFCKKISVTDACASPLPKFLEFLVEWKEVPNAVFEPMILHCQCLIMSIERCSFQCKRTPPSTHNIPHFIVRVWWLDNVKEDWHSTLLMTGECFSRDIFEVIQGTQKFFNAFFFKRTYFKELLVAASKRKCCDEWILIAYKKKCQWHTHNFTVGPSKCCEANRGHLPPCACCR